MRMLLIWFGANDACIPPSPQHVGLEKFSDNIVKIVQLVKSADSSYYSPDTEVLLLTPPPINTHQRSADLNSRDPPLDLDRIFDVTKAYADAVKAVAQREQTLLVDVWQVMWDKAGHDEQGLSKFLSDGLHCNAEGYEIVYEEIIRVIEERIPHLHYSRLQEVFPQYKLDEPRAFTAPKKCNPIKQAANKLEAMGEYVNLQERGHMMNKLKQDIEQLLINYHWTWKYFVPFTRARFLHQMSATPYGSWTVHARWAFNGLHDSMRWMEVIRLLSNHAKIRENMFKSLALNFISLISIYAFDLVLLPSMLRLRPNEPGESWLHHQNVGLAYQVVWVIPVITVTLYLNGFWCQEVAKQAYTVRHGSSPSTEGSLASMTQSLYRSTMIALCLLLSFCLGSLPYIGFFTSFVYTCWIDSYFCFEFVWISQGVSLSKRTAYLEERWAYFLGFGFTPTVACTFFSTMANTALFAMILPAYIILAMHARPAPIDPYNPEAVTSRRTIRPRDIRVKSQFVNGSSDTIRPFSTLLPTRLPIFAAILAVDDLLFDALKVVSGGKLRMHRLDDLDHRYAEEKGADIPISPPHTAGLFAHNKLSHKND